VPGVNRRADSRIEFTQSLSGGGRHPLGPLAQRGCGSLPGSGELPYRIVSVTGHGRIFSPGADCGQCSGGPAGVMRANVRNAAEIDELLGPGGGLCLDLGCGGGLYFAVLASTGRTVVGLDRSADQLRIGDQATEIAILQ
jgi:SAM-dependent methyltransferase